MDQPGLGAHLDGDHAGELQIVELLLKAAAHIGQVVVGLGVLLGAGLGRLLAELLQLVGADLVQTLLARQNIHGQLLVILGVELVHLVQHGDVLHQGHLMALQHLGDLVHVGLRLGVGHLHGLQLVFLLFEKAEDALLVLLLAEALQLHHQGGQGLADLPQILGAHGVEGALGKAGDVLLGRRAVLEHHVGVGQVDLLGKVVHHLPLRLGELALVELDGLLVLGLLGRGRIHRPGGVQGEGGRLGGLGCLRRRCGVQVGSEGQFRGKIRLVSHIAVPPLL